MRIREIVAVAFCVSALVGAFAETVDVPSGQTVTRTTALTEDLVKTGDGVYVLSAASDGFTGTIDVRGGVLEMANTEGIGSAASLNVADGAQFKVSAFKEHLFPVTDFTIAGDGPDGNGAIYTTEMDNRYQYLMSGRLTLAADATVTFAGYFQATGKVLGNGEPSGATWDFAGHDLTLVTPNGIELYGTGMEFVNPGNIYLKGNVTLSRSPSFHGGAENAIVLAKSGSTISFYNSYMTNGEAFPWTIVCAEDGTASASGLDRPQSQYVTLGGGIRLSPGRRLTIDARAADARTAADYRMYVAGPITGGGDGAAIQAKIGQFFATNTESDYEANLVVAGGGKLLFSGRGAFPKEGGSIQIERNYGLRTATVAFDMSPGGWSVEEVHAVMDAAQMVTGDNYESAPSVYVPAGVEIVDGTDIAEGRTFRMYGGGTYILKGSVANTATIRNDGEGRLIVSSDDKESAKEVAMKYHVGQGEVLLKDVGTVTVDVRKSKNVSVYSGIKEAIGRVAIEGETSFQSIPTNFGEKVFYPHVYPESQYENSRRGLSVLELRDGASMNAVVEAGALSGVSLGAFYVRGGEYTMPAATGETIYLGNSGCGYFEISGGTACISNRIFMSRNRFVASKNDNIGYGCTDALANGFIVRGGECTFANRTDMTLGLNGDAFYYQDGGDFTIEGNSMSVNAPLSWEERYGHDPNKWTGSVASVSIDAGRMSIASDFILGGRTNGTAYLNVNSGGVFSAPKIRSNVHGLESRTSLVGFNGGVFRANRSGDVIPSGDLAPNHVTVYRDGVTFDTAGYDVSVSVPLEGATGLGVTALTFPDAMPTNGYIGPHMVRIKGGSGMGALAVLDVNTTNNTLRGVRVVSPGFGYADGDALTALAKDGSYVDSSNVRRFGEYECGVALGSQSGGGLTKRGAGSLTLNAAVTYAGATTVEEGTLVLGVADALLNPLIVCKGGTVAVADGVAYQTGLEFDAEALTDKTRDYVLAKKWTGGTECVRNLSWGFSAKVLKGDLVVSKDYGMTIVIR